MKHVLVFAVLLLGLAIAADRERSSTEALGRIPVGELDWVQAFSTARGHAPAAQLPGEALSSIHFRRNKLQGRALNARGLTTAVNLPGVVVAAFDPIGELLGSDSYQPGIAAGETERLGEWCEGLGRGVLLVMTRRGSMSPRGPTAALEATRLEALFSGLGAEVRPWKLDAMSWAYAARRNDDGWTPVIEASSTTHGVMLTAPISPNDRSGPATAAEDDREGLSLLGSALEGHRVALGVTLKDRSVDTYVLPQGKTSELTWSDVDLRESSRFSALLSANESSRFIARGVVFHLLLDGVELDVIEMRTSAHERPSWLDWEVDLPKGAGPRELKIIAAPLPGSSAALPQVGAPLLIFGA